MYTHEGEENQISGIASNVTSEHKLDDINRSASIGRIKNLWGRKINGGIIWDEEKGDTIICH